LAGVEYGKNKKDIAAFLKRGLETASISWVELLATI
jgi:hypothetical protein